MSLKFTVNGFSYEVQSGDFAADITLNTFLREHLHLTATKYMCLEGGCGSCICAIRRHHPATDEIKTFAINSVINCLPNHVTEYFICIIFLHLSKCLMLLNSCNGVDIITDEGLGNKSSGYHPIQKRLARLNGSQCGYCSPGFVMNMYGLLYGRNGQVSMSEVEDSFGGNICRCTGYRPILDAMKSFAIDSNIQLPEDCVDIEEKPLCLRTGQCFSGTCPRATLQAHNNSQWFWPKSLEELFQALAQVPNGKEYMLVGGNTAHGVFRRSRNIQYFIDVNMVPELQQHSIEAQQLLLGSNLSLTETMQILQQAKTHNGFEYCEKLWQHFNLIANLPVRNVSTGHTYVHIS